MCCNEKSVCAGVVFKYLGFCIITWLNSFVCNNVAFLILFMRTIRGHKERAASKEAGLFTGFRWTFYPCPPFFLFFLILFRFTFHLLFEDSPNNVIYSSDLCSKLQTQSHVSHCHMRFSTSAFPLVFLSRK